MSETNIVVVGLGYVGIPVATAVSEIENFEVFGLDIDQEKITGLREKKDFSMTTDYSVVQQADKIIICLPTPVKDDAEPDLSIIQSSLTEVEKNLKAKTDIIIESTINPGVCDEKIIPLLEKNEKKLGRDFTLSHCPERINPGDNRWNVTNIPRVLGSKDEEVAKRIKRFYEEFIDANVKVVSDVRVAEATKIVENSFRDINIAFVNELAQSFDILGIDIKEVIDAASTKPFGFLPHYPGCGVGGHCIPVDPYYLINDAKVNGFTHDFLRMAREINEYMPEYTVRKVIEGLNSLEKSVKSTKIAVLGLSYKAGVEDMRGSPALKIVKELTEMEGVVEKYDPYVTENSLNDVLKHAEVAVIATDHEEIKNNQDWKNINLLVDGRNCLDKNQIEKEGILYEGIGR
mgnify:CR=1 FL=1